MKVVELLPQLHLLRFPIGNAYLWRDPAGLTLIDTGVSGSAPLIGKAIEELGYQRSDVQRLLLIACFGHGEPLTEKAADRLAEAVERLSG